jgi:hypothetical protein
MIDSTTMSKQRKRRISFLSTAGRRIKLTPCINRTESQKSQIKTRTGDGHAGAIQKRRNRL